MFKIFLAYLLLVFALSCKHENSYFNNEPYLKDYILLRNHVSSSYANLEYLTDYYNIDPYKLNKETIDKIMHSKSRIEAMEALYSFVNVFKDGHFKLVEPEKSRSYFQKNDSIKIEKNMSAKEACQIIGVSGDKDFGFKFLNNSNKIIKKWEGEFPSLLIGLKNNQKLGIIRIADFRDSVYFTSCTTAWPAFKKTIKNKCGQSCKQNFLNTYLREFIINDFYQKLTELKLLGADSLLLDLTNNGGGNDWVDQIIVLLTNKKIVCGKRGFVKHPHYVKMFNESLTEEMAKIPQNKTEINLLKKYIRSAEKKCDRSLIWTQNEYRLSCSAVDYIDRNKCKYDAIKLKGKEHFSGKLYILVNNKTASAAEDVVARHLDSKAAVVIGERTRGSGCGYMNGGIPLNLPRTGLQVRVPDCIRERVNGVNEVVGIKPNIEIDMSKIDRSDFLNNLIHTIENFGI